MTKTSENFLFIERFLVLFLGIIMIRPACSSPSGSSSSMSGAGRALAPQGGLGAVFGQFVKRSSDPSLTQKQTEEFGETRVHETRKEPTATGDYDDQRVDSSPRGA